MTLTKANIIEAVSDRTGFTKKQSRHSVNSLIEIIKKTLESGENIKIGHFGKFDIKEEKARPWRSPFTGKFMMLPARRTVKFKTFKRLKDRINAQPIGTESEERSRAKIRPIRTGALKKDELKKILADHRRWLDSQGKSGEKAVLSHAALVRADLYAAKLSFIDFQGADLREAVLSEQKPSCMMLIFGTPIWPMLSLIGQVLMAPNFSELLCRGLIFDGRILKAPICQAATSDLLTWRVPISKTRN